MISKAKRMVSLRPDELDLFHAKTPGGGQFRDQVKAERNQKWLETGFALTLHDTFGDELTLP